ncbi:hypothetical protein L5515_005848 [Caenorhabditis briggsae]|uniref:F-box associated domain-containing protein n=1 Tax=Caenorhabditis briggsae TaxID=6238 RepID=A0AAE9JHF5_CAEBR|nr:hypothetical protein L5515_005848 [Caenorhabditis briggsae]
MPINLLKMPDVVGVGVVTELDYQGIFLLSVCSRRSNCLVKKARITVPKLTFCFEKCDAYDSFVIGVKIYMMKWYYITSVKHVPKLDLEGVANANTVLDNEASSNIEFGFQTNERFQYRIERDSEPMEVQKEYQDYINSIFHYSGNYELCLSMECEGPLPNITNVKEIEIVHETVDNQFLTNALTKYPDTESLYVGSRIVGELPEDSPLLQVQNIYACRCGPDYFQVNLIQNFVGRNLYLESVTVTEQDLIRFIQKWISNEAYHNLEALVIFVDNPSSINADVIRQAIEFEEYDRNEPEKRPEYFLFDAPFINRGEVEPYSLRDKDYVEINRTTDGKRAFLCCDPGHLEFFVPKI